MGAQSRSGRIRSLSKKNDKRPPSHVFDARYRPRLTTQSRKWGPGVTIPGFQKTKRIDGPPAIAQRAQPRRMGMSNECAVLTRSKFAACSSNLLKVIKSTDWLLTEIWRSRFWIGI